MATSIEHRRRVLEHQGRQAKREDTAPGPKPEQQIMPLLTEVKRPGSKQPEAATKGRDLRGQQGKLPL